MASPLVARSFVIVLAAVTAAFSAVPGPLASLAPRPVREFRAIAPTPVPTAAPTPVPIPQFRPLVVEIPSLGVRAPVIPVGIDAGGAMGTPKTAHEVAWWDGVLAGQGNALLAGHKDWNKRQGSFYRLPELKPGEVVRLSGDGGAVLDFRVEWIRQMPGDAEAHDILGPQPAPVVTLITCGGQFDRRVRHYKDRVVVRAVLA